MFDNLKPIHLVYLKKAIAKYGKVFIHGDGNIYEDIILPDGQDSPSDFAKKFHSEAAEYRMAFNKGDKVPETIDELTRMFLEAKTRENYEASKATNVRQQSFLDVEDDEIVLDNEPIVDQKANKGKLKK